MSEHDTLTWRTDQLRRYETSFDLALNTGITLFVGSSRLVTDFAVRLPRSAEPMTRGDIHFVVAGLPVVKLNSSCLRYRVSLKFDGLVLPVGEHVSVAFTTRQPDGMDEKIIAHVQIWTKKAPK